MDNIDNKDDLDINADDNSDINSGDGDMDDAGVNDVELFELKADVDSSTFKSDSVSNSENSDSEKLSLADVVYEWIDAAVFSLVVIAFIFTFIARQVQVDGPSMENTLHTGERLIMTGFAYTPKKGDIVIVNRKSDTPLIKRVIATAGDKIEIAEGMVYVDGVALAEEYAVGRTELHSFAEGEQVVPEGKILILGDNREHSEDSRSSRIGFVNADEVMGKAIFRFYPTDKIGGLY